MDRKRVAQAAVLLGFILIAGSLGAYFLTATPQAPLSGNGLPDTPPTRGGPFELVDHTGRAVTDRDYHGRFLLVFFGYTYCPDICPTELQTLAEVMDLLGEAGEKVVPIFVTVDPERDTVEVMADYVDAFHPRIVGLTGTPAQIADVAAVYKAGYMKLTMPVAKGPDADDGLDYGMGHSALTYLVGPAGRVLTTYPRGTAPTALMADIGQYLGGRQ